MGLLHRSLGANYSVLSYDFYWLGAWHEVALRAPHFLVPLALLVYVSKREKKFLNRCLSVFKNLISKRNELQRSNN